MRYASRLREKYEVSLDNRQIVSLVAGALALLGAAFALGVVVGRQLATALPPSVPVNDLDALDQRRAEADAVLAPARVASPPVAVEKPATPPPPKATPAPANPPPAPPSPVPAKVAPREVYVAEPEPPPSVVEKHEAPLAKPAPTPPASKAATAKAVVAIAKPQPKAAEKAPEPKAVAVAAAEAKFAIQIASTQSREEAERIANRLKGKGYAAYVLEADLGKKGTWLRVRVGKFADKDAADRYRADVERETGERGLVMPLK